MTQEALVLQISVGFGQGVEPFIDKDNVVVRLRPGQIVEFSRFARDKLGFDMLDAITAVDNVDDFELLYHWVSVKPLSPNTVQPTYPGYLLARVNVAKNLGIDPATAGPDAEPVVPSVTPVYPGANQQEREIWDLMGIRFKGHPRLQRILLWEGFPGHPLRKDWKPVNAEIPWHLAGLKGWGGEPMENPPAEARIADDGSGISQPIPVGTTPQGFMLPPTRKPKPTEVMRIKIGQNGLVDDDTPFGPRSGYGALGATGLPREEDSTVEGPGNVVSASEGTPAEPESSGDEA